MSVSAPKLGQDPGPNPGSKPRTIRAQILGWATLAVVLAGVIVWAAIQSEDPLSRYVQTDKMRHILAFGAIGLCAGLMPSPLARLLAISGVSAFALLIEVIQIPVPDRSASFGDLFASLVGGFAGFGLCAAITSAWAEVRSRLSQRARQSPPAP